MVQEAIKHTILIVDDSLVNIMILEKALMETYNLITANCGEEALSVCKKNKSIDLIILDVVMPDMNGYEVCKKLKETPETRDTPIIFITAMSTDGYEEYGLNIGAIDYIIKPFNIDIVKVRIKNQLDLKRYRDLLKEYSMIDDLTGIANRRAFNDTLLLECNKAKRDKTTLSIIMVDIDFFKNYNDIYGHVAGDECLKSVAHAVKSEVKRVVDTVSRWGGEEFACILSDTNIDSTLIIAENIRKRILRMEIPHIKSSVSNFVTVSLGVASIVPSNEETCDKIIKKADEALYRAKNEGRNRVCH